MNKPQHEDDEVAVNGVSAIAVDTDDVKSRNKKARSSYCTLYSI